MSCTIPSPCWSSGSQFISVSLVLWYSVYFTSLSLPWLNPLFLLLILELKFTLSLCGHCSLARRPYHLHFCLPLSIFCTYLASLQASLSALYSVWLTFWVMNYVKMQKPPFSPGMSPYHWGSFCPYSALHGTGQSWSPGSTWWLQVSIFQVLLDLLRIPFFPITSSNTEVGSSSLVS